jgi:hypothetical protein
MFVINGEQWIVIFVGARHPALLKPNGDFAIGACDDFSKTIYLNENLSGDYLRSVLCHEITHAIMFSFNIKMPLPQEELFAELMSAFGSEIVKITNLLFSQILKRKGRL